MLVIVISSIAMFGMIAVLFPPLKYMVKINQASAMLYSYIGIAAFYLLFLTTFSSSIRELHLAFVCLYIITGALGILKEYNLARYPLSVLGFILMYSIWKNYILNVT